MSSVAGGMSGEKTLGMLEDLMHKLRKGVLTEKQFDHFLKKENPFTKHDSQVIDWEEFYREVFNFREVDFSNLVVPPERDAFDWLIVVLKGLTANEIFKKYAERMGVWLGVEDLDKDVVNDRKPEKTYAIWVRSRVEADRENKSIPADRLSEEGIFGTTLTERLILGLFYSWKAQDGHLDSQSKTLCSGSRYSDGTVPTVGFRDGKLVVDWCATCYSSSFLRARSVVS